MIELFYYYIRVTNKTKKVIFKIYINIILEKINFLN